MYRQDLCPGVREVAIAIELVYLGGPFPSLCNIFSEFSLYYIRSVIN